MTEPRLMCYNDDMFRKVLSVITLILLAFVIWNAKDEILQAVNFLGQTNIWVVLLLIPEQLFMYYCCGQIFFSYMYAKANSTKTTSDDQIKKLKPWTLMRISFELNFVNHAVPSGGVSGLGYIAWRLKPYGSSYAQTSFMYLLRYLITSIANQVQTLIAIAILLISKNFPAENSWILWLVALSCVGVIFVVFLAIFIISNKKRIAWFAKIITNVVNWLVKTVTFGHKTEVLKKQVVEDYCTEFHASYQEARKNKKILIHPIIWGFVYSFFEITTYWIIALSMGHPEIFAAILVGEAIGSVFAAVLPTPGGVGGYEGSMIFIMSLLGVEVGLATAVVVTTRMAVLVGTISSGYGFYQHAISKIGKKEKDELKKFEEGSKLHV